MSSSIKASLDESIDIASNPVLFGAQRQAGLVGISADKKTGELFCYRRSEQGLSTHQVEDFQPFLWLADLDALSGLQTNFETIELSGSNTYRHLIRTQSWADCKEVSAHIASFCGKYASHPDSPQLFINDLATQYLLSTGQTYYNKMAIEDLRYLLIRVYTAGDVEAEPDDPDRIVAVALRDELDKELFLIDDPEEDKLLWHLSGKVKKLDPDIIAGHNLFKRDLLMVKERAKKKKVRLDWGRQKERLSGRRTRMMVAEKQLDYHRFQVGGRELVDSWILSILHDVSGREMLGYDFEDVCDHFSLEYGCRKDSIEERAEKDTLAISRLHRHLVYPYFLQSQIFPLSFENVILRGNATRINHLFLREYLRQETSIPSKPEAVHFAGGLTAQEHSGCARGVYHCDVASLYPSLIVSSQLGPQLDSLNIFTDLLESLRDFRLSTKAREKEADTDDSRAFFGNLQTTFKILINSFYGYLGFAQGHFADFDRAAEVTRKGRELLQEMMAWLKKRGAHILEVDTDGIYFVPSESFASTEWIEELNGELPEGVQVEFDGRYPGMYCHKMKNYALLEDNGKLVLRGSGLRSRAMEPFLRNFIEDLIKNALSQGKDSRLEVLSTYEEKLKGGEFSIDELAKTETLIDNPAAYQKKIEKGGRNRAAVYELALAASRKYRAGELISYYVIGDKASVTVYDNCKRVDDFDPAESDLNVKYYLKKLKATFKKFDPILGSDELVCPLPYEDLPAAVH